MTTPAMTEGRHDPVWEVFARRHASNRFLELDALYALSEPIIDAIQASVPRFFSAEQEWFERDLARTASFGFFHQRPLGRAATLPPEQTAQPSLAERQRCLSEQIHELLGAEMHQAGATAYEIGEFFAGSAERNRRVEDRQNAYAGWLVTNPQFRREVGTLRQRWEGMVRAIRSFPTLPMWFIPDATADRDLPAEFREEFEAFYCRWGLETMRTWDWPVPMEPDFVGGLREGIKHLSQAGLTLFMPWYVLRGERIDLQDIARLCRIGSVPDHLCDWVNKRGQGGGDDRGEVRYKNLLWLYRFHELVLLRRFPRSCKGHLERLDYALARVLERDQDSVKKLRLQLRRAVSLPS
ncbi:MAG TPA: hypothetical protein VKU02_03180 [Gemmataceae bacterium]|nr:hypothetical protein [Gemmataceae bacterium]